MQPYPGLEAMTGVLQSLYTCAVICAVYMAYTLVCRRAVDPAIYTGITVAEYLLSAIQGALGPAPAATPCAIPPGGMNSPTQSHAVTMPAPALAM